MPPHPQDTQVKRNLLGNRSLKSAKFAIFRPILPTKVLTFLQCFCLICVPAVLKAQIPAPRFPSKFLVTWVSWGRGGTPGKVWDLFITGFKSYSVLTPADFFVNFYLFYQCLWVFLPKTKKWHIPLKKLCGILRFKMLVVFYFSFWPYLKVRGSARRFRHFDVYWNTNWREGRGPSQRRMGRGRKGKPFLGHFRHALALVVSRIGGSESWIHVA